MILFIIHFSSGLMAFFSDTKIRRPILWVIETIASVWIQAPEQEGYKKDT